MLTELLVVFVVSTATAQTGPPVFEDGGFDFGVEEGYKAEVWCRATGEKPITYEWYDQSGKEIPSDLTLSVHSLATETSSALIFDVFNRIYEGLYTCSAKNVHGLRAIIYNITAFPTKNETVGIQSVKIVNVTDVSVTFSLTVRGKPSGYVVKYIEKLVGKEETLIFLSEQSSVVDSVSSSAEIKIDGLIPSGSYKFRFMAKSALTANEEWSNITRIVLLPDAPEVIFRSLGNRILKIEWFRKWTDVVRDTIDEYKLAYRYVSQKEGNFWDYSGCFRNVTIPACDTASHTVADLQNGWTEFRLSSHTKSGYGKSTNFKVRIE